MIGCSSPAAAARSAYSRRSAPVTASAVTAANVDNSPNRRIIDFLGGIVPVYAHTIIDRPWRPSPMPEEPRNRLSRRSWFRNAGTLLVTSSLASRALPEQASTETGEWKQAVLFGLDPDPLARASLFLTDIVGAR